MVALLRLLSLCRHLIEVARAQAIRLWAVARYWNPLYPWLIRWWLRTNLPVRTPTSAPQDLSDIPVFFINLERRTDRATQIYEEFSRLGLRPPERFNAIEDPNPMLGAAKSHLKVLEESLSSFPGSMIMVCEDDLVFQCSRDELNRAVEEFARDKRLDVLCLAFMIKNLVREPTIKRVSVGENLLVSNQIITQACYVVKPRAMRKVIQSLRQSVRLLSAGVQWRYAAGDVHWQTLQQGTLFFSHPEKRLARQSPGHSDIWNLYKDLEI